MVDFYHSSWVYLTMAKQVALLFPGQGAQSPEMARNLYQHYEVVKKLFKESSQTLGIDIKKVLFETTQERLNRSDYSQIALGISNLSSLLALKEEKISPDIVAGFSAGEWSALASAQIITTEQSLSLLKIRGEIMEKWSKMGTEQGMMAIIGLSSQKISQIIEDYKIGEIYLSNLNSKNQTVLSGSLKALREFEIAVKESKEVARLQRLKTAGAFHSPFMAEAEKEFLPYIDSLILKAPAITYISSISGKKETSPSEIKELLKHHITSPLLWNKTKKSILEENPTLLIECGHGKTLKGLWKEHRKILKCHLAGNREEILQCKKS